MKPSRRVSRRSFFLQAPGGAVSAAGALALMTGRAKAQVTDNDTGANSDLPGFGRGGSGVTDHDTGANADPLGNGRGPGPSGCSDNDAGDPEGRGRRCQHYANDLEDRGADREPQWTGITDNDRGSPNADLDGRGRGTREQEAQRPSGYTDGDPSDPAGNGRRYQGGPPYTGHTDADPGDRAGYGRGGAPRCTDADTGSHADAAGAGRYCPN